MRLALLSTPHQWLMLDSVRFRARLRCKDGTIKHVLLNANVLWEDGRFIHTRCFTRDITERRRAQEDLQQQSELLRVTLASRGGCSLQTANSGRGRQQGCGRQPGHVAAHYGQ
jgi:PAS domain-containing protein